MYKTKGHYYLIVEYCNGGDLESLLNAGLRLRERHVAYIFGQVLSGMKEMLGKGILHRDIKNANILISIPDDKMKTII